jgi:hypothetical protein
LIWTEDKTLFAMPSIDQWDALFNWRGRTWGAEEMCMSMGGVCLEDVLLSLEKGRSAVEMTEANWS